LGSGRRASSTSWPSASRPARCWSGPRIRSCTISTRTRRAPPSSASFSCQLFFLLNRFRQQQELAQGNLFRQSLVCDYIFAKDRIFAYLNLNDSELMVYEKIYTVLEEQVPHPDLVIYLQARDDVLMERIRKRKRDYEKEISEKYVSELNRAYNYFFFHYSRTPLLVIETSDIDFVNSQEDLEEVLRQIKSMQRGVQYYIPLGSSRGPGWAGN
jgi:deoxyadenosine/deoxycytidine kinase